MKRVVLLSLGLFSLGAYVGCLPSDMPGSATGGSSGQATGGSGNTSTTGGAPGSGGNDNPTGTGGDSGPQGSGGSSTGGVVGTGTGGSGTGSGGRGEGGAAGAGTGGRSSTGGAVGTGTGGAATGTGGAAGMTGGGTGGTTANPVCDSVKSFLNGFQYLLPCGADQNYSVLVCQNTKPACAYSNSEYLVEATCNADKKFTVAGTSSQSCTITLHVQGIVEPKHYLTGTNRCTTNYGTAYEGFASGPANGGSDSGCYPNLQGNYNVYMMHVSDNGTFLGKNLTGTRYYWNAINKTEAHFSYKIDYTTPPITIKGGQQIWMLADDSNASAIKNCDTSSNDQATYAAGGKCNPLQIANLDTSGGAAIAQPYAGQFITLHVASAQ
ncbi:MAG TPA: hypothetical protein VHM31_10110 [Polyangia bacterium]|nr:hypothetical protein [Polyangia bacterium]